MPAFHTLDDLDVAGKRALVRADLNVPLKDGRVAGRTRIERLLPTLTELSARGARVVILSHLGRPGGEVVEAMSLRPLVAALAEALGGRNVAFASDCVGAPAEDVVAGLGDGDFALLENLRFHPGEEANDPAFAGKLATLGECYVNDAFSCAHRAHASVVSLPRLMPAAAGRGMEAELEALGHALASPARPMAAVIGGAKISNKLGLLASLVARVDILVIGGAMANTMLHAHGIGIGESVFEPGMEETAAAIMANARASGCEIVLPEDGVVADALEPRASSRIVPIGQVPDDAMILDIGPATVAAVIDRLAPARTLIWNGPLGAFETPPFDAGTTAVARAVAKWTREGRLTSIAGGGDTLAALSGAGVNGDFSYVSAAGGAFLEWLEGKELPGVVALDP